MYRCSVCKNCTEAGEPRKNHVIKALSGVRKGQILQELPVCGRCGKLLSEGVALCDLLAKFAPPTETIPAVLIANRPIKPAQLGKPAPRRQSLWS